MNRPLADLRRAVIMLDGIELHRRTNIVALGVATEGGLDVEQGLLFVIGGSKALRKALRQTVIRLGITGKLKLTLQSTNPIEPMISTDRVIHRNVKHWSCDPTHRRQSVIYPRTEKGAAAHTV